MHTCRRAGICVGGERVVIVTVISITIAFRLSLSLSLSVFFFIVCLLCCHLSAWPCPRQQHGSTAALAGCVASSLSLSVCVVSSLAGWPRHHLSSLSSSVCMASSSLSMWQCSSTGWLGGLVVVVVVVVVCLLHCCLSAWTRCHLPGWLHGPIVIPWVLSLSSPWVMLLLSLLSPSPWRCHHLCCGHHVAVILWMLCRVWEGEGGW